jgi:hypothetical protein
MRFIFFISVIVLFAACQKNIPEPALKEFSDDFESYADTSTMVLPDGSAWTKFNINEINTSSEAIRIDTIRFHSGRQSVRFHCKQTDLNEICKCNLNKEGLHFKAGETVYYSGWYYIERNDIFYGTFFVWDLEAVVDGTLGIRVMAWEENLELERNKMGLPNIFQDEDVTLFPVNQWTHLEMEIQLSQYRKGSVKMWLDGKEIIYRNNVRTLPKDQMNLLWATHGYYDRLQVGITAKTGTEELTMYVDDVTIRRK